MLFDLVTASCPICDSSVDTLTAGISGIPWGWLAPRSRCARLCALAYSRRERDQREDAAGGHPRLAGRALPLAAHAQRGVLGARARLDVRSAAPPPARLADAVRGLPALGFIGANVTAPHKLAVAALCESDAPSVNTLVVRDGVIEGRSTDAAVLADLPSSSAVVIGDGGAAIAFLRALPHARQFSRRGVWPPDADGADLVVNATSARDDVVVRVGRGQTLVDLPYPETATAIAARRAGSTVVTGLRRSRRARRCVVRALDRYARAGRRHARGRRIQVTDCYLGI